MSPDTSPSDEPSLSLFGSCWSWCWWHLSHKLRPSLRSIPRCFLRHLSPSQTGIMCGHAWRESQTRGSSPKPDAMDRGGCLVTVSTTRQQWAIFGVIVSCHKILKCLYGVQTSFSACAKKLTFPHIVVASYPGILTKKRYLISTLLDTQTCNRMCRQSSYIPVIFNFLYLFR